MRQLVLSACLLVFFVCSTGTHAASADQPAARAERRIEGFRVRVDERLLPGAADEEVGRAAVSRSLPEAAKGAGKDVDARPPAWRPWKAVVSRLRRNRSIVEGQILGSVPLPPNRHSRFPVRPIAPSPGLAAV
jgi:hypothetical protein